jgi:hypothetical protein
MAPPCEEGAGRVPGGAAAPAAHQLAAAEAGGECGAELQAWPHVVLQHEAREALWQVEEVLRGPWGGEGGRRAAGFRGGGRGALGRLGGPACL